jgi:hypothetical protein
MDRSNPAVARMVARMLLIGCSSWDPLPDCKIPRPDGSISFGKHKDHGKKVAMLREGAAAPP